MRLTVMSLWRNSARNAPTYFERLRRFADTYPHIQVRALAVEGDSTDNTQDALHLAARYYDVPMDLVVFNHGGPVHGSTEAPERMKQLSAVFNAGLDAAPGGFDVLVYVENDLRWEPESIFRLVDGVDNRPGIDVLAPKVMADTAFYDIWAFRGLDGQRFSPFNPWHVDVQRSHPGDYVELSSVGSCLAMRPPVARQVRIRDDNAIVGWCADARGKGYSIYMDPGAEVRQL